MRTKIKEALKQGYKNLGLSEEVFERVAASVETFITDESQIDGFVSSENTKGLLTSYQSVNDKLRSLEKKIKPVDPITPEPTPAPLTEPNPNPTPNPPLDIAQLISDAVSQAIKPLNEELNNLKNVRTQETAVSEAISRINAWDYAKGYPKEIAKAQKQAMELYEAYGKTWTAAELEAKIREKFNDEVADKGIDTTKPFESDKSADDVMPDFESIVAQYRNSGRMTAKE